MKRNKLNFYKENGYLLEDELFSHKECDELISNSHKINDDDKINDLSPLINPHLNIKYGNVFLDVLKKKSINDFLTSQIGLDKSLLQTQFFFMPPKTPGFAAHQDDFYVRSSNKNLFISLWIPLVDTNNKNGCLSIFKGTHCLKILNVQEKKVLNNANTDKNGSRLECQVPSKYISNNIPMKKGTGMWIHSRMVHKSSTNHSNCNRYAILFTFINNHIFFKKGKNVKRKKIDLDLI